MEESLWVCLVVPSPLQAPCNPDVCPECVSLPDVESESESAHPGTVLLLVSLLGVVPKNVDWCMARLGGLGRICRTQRVACQHNHSVERGG